MSPRRALRRSPILCLALAPLGCGTTLQTAGYAAADGRAFVLPPKYAGQTLDTGVSLVAEPEASLKSDDGEHRLVLRPFYRVDPNDERRTHADVRQASYRLSLTHFEAGAGAGIFTWGVLESYRPTDVMNQMDFVEAYDGSAKLGQPYAEVGWVGETASLKVYYLPYFRERTFPGVAGRLRFASLIDTDNTVYGTSLKQFQPSAAARAAFTFGDLELGLGLFTGLSREPRFVLELTSGDISPHYDPMHQGSVDAQWTIGGFVLKGEGLVRMWSPSQRRFFAAGGAGVDKTMIKVGEAELALVAEYLFDTRPADAPPTFFAHNAFGGLRLALNDAATTEITAGDLVDVVDGTSFARLAISRGFGNHWKAAVDGNLFLGPTGTLEASFVKDDYVHLRIAYYF